MKLFEMKHIKKSFDGLEVLKDISLDVEEGEVLSIIGPSGSGKSTILRCATGLETPDSGEIIKTGNVGRSCAKFWWISGILQPLPCVIFWWRDFIIPIPGENMAKDF